MEKEILKEKDYAEELVYIIRKNLQEKKPQELLEKLSDYHENDIAEALTRLTVEERRALYPILGVERVAEIFAYLDEDEQEYFKELSIDNMARVVSEMDSDDAVDILENLEESTKEEIVKRLDKDAGEDVRMLLSYDEDEIGSCMTTNYICIHENLNIRQAMSELVRQAGENDNISTIYVVDDKEIDKEVTYFGPFSMNKRLTVLREFLLDYFMLPTCNSKSKCIRYDIKKCLGPCVVDSSENYKKIYKRI